MKKPMPFAVVLATVAFVSLSSSADVTTIGPGETLSITDANVALYADGITFADATGIAEFNTSAGPAMTLTGAGTVRKTSSAVWTLAKDQGNFTGGYEIAAGAVTQMVAKAFGHCSLAGVGKLKVRSGATVVFGSGDSTINFFNRVIEIEGTGDSRYGGVLQFAQSPQYVFGTLRLVADARFSVDKNQSAFVCNGVFDLNGFTLTKVGEGGVVFLNGELGDGPGELTISEGNLTFRDGTVIGGTDPINFIGARTLGLNERVAPFARALTIDGSLNVTYADYAWKKSAQEFNWTTTNYNYLAGPVRFVSDGSSLKPYGYSTWYRISFAGPISGPGSVRFLTTPDVYGSNGRVALMSPTNSYTGGTFASGLGCICSVLAASYSNSIPDYAATDVTQARLAAMVRDDGAEHAWTPEALSRLYAQATWRATDIYPAFLSLDTSEVTNDVYELNGADWTAGAPKAYVGLAHEGPKPLVLRGSYLGSLCLGNFSGELRVTGDGPFEFGRIYATSETATNGSPSKLVLDGAKNVHMGAAPLVLGGLRNDGDRSWFGSAELKIKDSSLDSEIQTGNPGPFKSDIVVGYQGTGVVEICGASEVSDRFVVGYKNGGSKDACGAFYMRSGTVFNYGGKWASGEPPVIGCGGEPAALGCGLGTYGYGELAGGTLQNLGVTEVGHGGQGIFAQYGGTFSTVTYPSGHHCFYLSGSENGRGEMYLAGGTATIKPSNGFVMGNGRNGTAILTVDGTADLTVEHINAGWREGSTSVINLCGGSLATTDINQQQTNGFFTTAPEVYLNFNGGKLASCGGNQFDIFHRYANRPDLTRITVFEKGGTIGFASGNYAPKIKSDIHGATGKGVASIPVPAEISGRKLIGPPAITIEGDGAGATAFALFDSQTRTVTNIVVTCPGWDYTTATATFTTGTGVTNAVAACELADNKPGFLRFENASYAELYGTNTYGNTIVPAGSTVYAYSDGAIPTNASIILNGGQLNMREYPLHAISVGGTGGTLHQCTAGSMLDVIRPDWAGLSSEVKVTNNNWQPIPLRATGVWTVDVEDLLAGRCADYPTMIFGPDAQVVFTGDFSRLSKDVDRYVFFRAANGYTGAPTAVAPEGWRFVANGATLALKPVKGMMLIVR